MGKIFDISEFDSYREDNRREVKRAKGGLPASLWETYSAFANCYGGVIILGVDEKEDGSWKTSGLKSTDQRRLVKDFWDNIHNPLKVSDNILTDNDVTVYEMGEDIVLVIHVPMARREQKPIFLNNDMFRYTFRRSHEGDYHCTGNQVKAMVRDQPESTMDMKVLDLVPMADLNYETVRGYRNRHRVMKPGHPFERLTDEEYLRSIGAAAISDEDHQLHPTAAGMLMFGDEYNIVRQYPEYFLDYREMLDPSIRWTDRIYSSTGDWSGNICDFYFRVYNKLIHEIKVPFRMNGGDRIDDTPVHQAIREALANCLVNTDFYGVRGVIIKKEPGKLIFENPGYIRTGKEQMRKGGISDPRNKTLLKMFNLINIGERSGSGVPNIFNIWEDEGWVEPVIEEEFEPERTILTLEFRKKVIMVKSSEDKSSEDKSSETKGNEDKSGGLKIERNQPKRKKTQKTLENMNKIRTYLRERGEARTNDIAESIGLGAARTRKLLSEMDDVLSTGETTCRRYKLKNVSDSTEEK